MTTLLKKVDFTKQCGQLNSASYNVQFSALVQLSNLGSNMRSILRVILVGLNVPFSKMCYFFSRPAVKCKIYLSDMGFGHLVRQRAIYEQLQQLMPSISATVQTGSHAN